MKRKVFFIVTIFCVGLQLSIIFGSENKQNWFDWLYSKFKTSRTGGIIAQKAVYETMALASRVSGVEVAVIGDIVNLFSAVIEDIGPIISSYSTDSVDRDEAIEKIKSDLRIIIYNSLIYPTRSSKINALLKKDEFLQYVKDPENLVEEACNQLIQEISVVVDSETKKATDKVLDSEMLKLKEEITSQQSLREKLEDLKREETAKPLAIDSLRAEIMEAQSLSEQIRKLELKLEMEQKFNIPKMQAYLSLYFRLKNKQRVEDRLTKEEKEIQQPWDISKPRFKRGFK